MVVVTLVCVALGGVMGRIEYLRRWAGFHDREQARHLVQWRQEYASFDKGSGSAASEAHELTLLLLPDQTHPGPAGSALESIQITQMKSATRDSRPCGCCSG